MAEKEKPIQAKLRKKANLRLAIGIIGVVLSIIAFYGDVWVFDKGFPLIVKQLGNNLGSAPHYFYNRAGIEPRNHA